MDRILIETINLIIDKVVIVTKTTDKHFIVNTFKFYHSHDFDSDHRDIENVIKQESKPLTSPEMRDIFKEEINKCIDWFIPFWVYSDRDDFFKKFPYYRKYLNDAFKKEYYDFEKEGVSF